MDDVARMSDLNNLIDPAISQLRELISQNKHAEALPLVENVLRRTPTDPAALKMLALCAAVTGQPEFETGLLEALAPAAKEDAVFTAYRAQALGNVGRFDEAMPLFENRWRWRRAIIRSRWLMGWRCCARASLARVGDV